MLLSKCLHGLATTLVLAVAILATDTHAAFSQSFRSLNRSVEPGKQIEFQWSNYDEATCRDNGYASFEVTKRPKLGKFRTVKKRVRQDSGKCKGSRFSVLHVYYVAGRKRGTDRTAYTIKGGSSIKINLKVNIK